MRLRFPVFLLSIVAAAVLGPVAWMEAMSTTAATLPPQQQREPVLLLASLNTAKVDDADVMVRELESRPALRDADVIFMQEVVRKSDHDASVAERLAARMGRQAVFASPEAGGTESGLAILSRTPLEDVHVYRLKPQNLIFRSRKRIAIGATINSVDGRVRIINTHLDTRINPAQRIDQLGPALEDARLFSGPSVIGGDFNTNDMQWVSNVVPVPFPGWQAARVRILMESRGFHTPFLTRRATFDHLGMQLDWIYTNTLRPVGSGVQPIEFSDHHAIWAQLAAPR